MLHTWLSVTLIRESGNANSLKDYFLREELDSAVKILEQNIDITLKWKYYWIKTLETLNYHSLDAVEKAFQNLQDFSSREVYEDTAPEELPSRIDLSQLQTLITATIVKCYLLNLALDLPVPQGLSRWPKNIENFMKYLNRRKGMTEWLQQLDFYITILVQIRGNPYQALLTLIEYESTRKRRKQ